MQHVPNSEIEIAFNGLSEIRTIQAVKFAQILEFPIDGREIEKEKSHISNSEFSFPTIH